MKTIKNFKIECIELLKKNNVDEPIIIVNGILEKVLKKTKIELLAYDNTNLKKTEEILIKKHIKKIIQGIPLQYLTNKKEFMGYEIYVNKNVLIPRNDTEILVEKCIEIIEKISKQDLPIKIMDMCTGSGCIPVSILMYFKDKNKYIYDKISILCVDVSSKALNVTKKNIKKYKLDNKIKLVKSNIFEKVPQEKFQLIISNPPYIETNTIDNLNENVKKEPHIALDGGKDGLYFYKEITSALEKYLIINGYVAYEIGYNQGKNVSDILKVNGFNSEIIKDLSNNDRVVIGNR